MSTAGAKHRPLLRPRRPQVGVLNWFARLWEIDEQEYWGYITNCGTEGNLHGILVGRENLPDGILYASRETHYSIFKAARMYRMDSVKVRPGPGAGKVPCRPCQWAAWPPPPPSSRQAPPASHAQTLLTPSTPTQADSLATHPGVGWLPACVGVVEGCELASTPPDEPPTHHPPTRPAMLTIPPPRPPPGGHSGERRD